MANELGFRPRKSSQSTDLQRTRVIGLILPNIINPMFPRWAQGVISAAADSGYEVFVATTQDDPEILAQVTATLANRNVDGVILAASLRDDARALRTLRAARIPYVCLSRRADFLDSDFVGIDDDAAATLLMQHMLGHGYTEIATVIGPRFSTASLAREQAFVRTAAAAGVVITGDRKISTRVNNEGGRLAAGRSSPPAHRRRQWSAAATSSPSASWNTPWPAACDPGGRGRGRLRRAAAQPLRADQPDQHCPAAAGNGRRGLRHAAQTHRNPVRQLHLAGVPAPPPHRPHLRLLPGHP